MNQGIIFSDRISSNMYLDFLKTLYIKGKIEILSLTIYDSEELVIEKLKNLEELKEKNPDISYMILVKAPREINQENKVIQRVKESSDSLIRLSVQVEGLMEILKGNEEIDSIKERWVKNVKRLAEF